MSHYTTTSDPALPESHKRKRESSVDSNSFSVEVPPATRPLDQYRPASNPLAERVALLELLALPRSSSPDKTGEVCIDLNDFTICSERGTLALLSDLKIRRHNTLQRLSGTLALGAAVRRVRNVTFEVLSIDGYEVDVESVDDRIYIQTPHAKALSVWYRLGRPAEEYARFFNDFLWLANFTKHFTSYLSEHVKVTLLDFRSAFHAWLQRQYSHSTPFTIWHSKIRGRDFRKVVAAYPEYLRRESTNEGVDPEGYNGRHPIWHEVHPDQQILGAVEYTDSPLDAKIIVTPYVRRCFSHYYFADQLTEQSPSNNDHKVYITRWHRRLQWLPVKSKHALDSDPGACGAQQLHTDDTTIRVNGAGPVRTRSIHVGDVVGVTRDAQGLWKDGSSTWFAYVHAIEIYQQRKKLNVLWLYRPEDTIMGGTTHYAYENELFLSDHCNCRGRESVPIFEEDVVDLPRTTLFSHPIPPAEGFFIRSTYITEETQNQFITLEPAHLNCGEHHPNDQIPSPRYPVSSFSLHATVLARLTRHANLEPVEIVSELAESFTARKFIRRDRDCGLEGLPNELVYTNLTVTIPKSRVIRQCHIRPYTRRQVVENTVPAPYSYGGVADCFIVSACLMGTEISDIKDSFRHLFEAGFDPQVLSDGTHALSTLDLFCGGGSFCRGFEDSNIATHAGACDIDGPAIHTKRANLQDPLDEDALFWGSAVQYMKLALEGSYSRQVAIVGTIQLILAGSPCQGFSGLQQDKTSVRSRRNAAMVALVLAFVDLYRPEYCFLENVYGITKPLGEKRDQNVFAQIVCTLVGMGYQIQYFQINAVNHGAAQSRTRIVVSIAAPGLKPLAPLAATHSPPNERKPRKMGDTINGVPFGGATVGKTPFHFVSAQEATRDLPELSGTGICIADPDHRPSIGVAELTQLAIRLVPRFPRGVGIGFAVRKRLIDHDLFEIVSEGRASSAVWNDLKLNRALTRIHPDLPYDTIITNCQPTDARSGKYVHWDEHRVMTIAEARRAQSIPDHEVLIGSPAQQWKIVGNGVDRHVAASLGVMLREAWTASCRTLGSDQSVSGVEPASGAFWDKTGPTLEDQDHMLGTPFHHRPRASETAPAGLLAHVAPSPPRAAARVSEVVRASSETSTDDDFIVVKLTR